jgi:hypothetical protein
VSFLFKKKAVSVTLGISPPRFQVESEKSLTLNAILGLQRAPSNLINWSLEGPGMLSTTEGHSTTYQAPRVEVETRVRVIATFPKTKEYLDGSAYVEGTILPAGRVAKIATVLIVSPPSFSIRSGETLELKSNLMDYEGYILAREVKWKISLQIGTLSSSIGSSVVYSAPKVEVETPVTIVALFEEGEGYLGSEASCVGMVAPITAFEEYILSFDKAESTNFIIEGPIEFDGVKTTKITADILDTSGLKISRVNLSSISGTLEKVEIYATRIKVHSLELGKTLEVKREEEVKIGPIEGSLEGGTIYLVKMNCLSGELDAVEVMGNYLGKEEPYLPILLTSSSISMDKGFAVTGPTSYGKLENKATKIVCGRITASNFSFKCPSEYNLDREDNKHEFVEKWILGASNATIENSEIYSIYFKIRALLVWRVRATGEKYIPSIIPEGMHRGEKAPINEADVDIIYLKADKLKVNNASFYLKLG